MLLTAKYYCFSDYIEMNQNECGSQCAVVFI